MRLLERDEEGLRDRMGVRIMIVDDNVPSAKLARVVFEDEDYEVAVAVDAVSARLLVASFAPAIILMDVQLPCTDGLALTRELKADPRYAAIPIVILTSYAMKGDEEKARAAGCDAYVTKPIDIVALPELVASLLKR